MNELIAEYIKGKSMYPPLRRLLTLLLYVSISSYFYTLIFGKYDLDFLDDYKSIIYYFINGEFIIPFTILIITFIIVRALSYILFLLITQWKTLTEGICDSLKHKPITVEKTVAFNLTKPKEKIPEKHVKYNTEIKPQLNTIELNFNLCVLIFIAETVYFISLDKFSCMIYIFSVLIIIVIACLLIITYKFLVNLPELIENNKDSFDDNETKHEIETAD